MSAPTDLEVMSHVAALRYTAAMSAAARQFEVGDGTDAALVGLTDAKLWAPRDQLTADLAGGQPGSVNLGLAERASGVSQ